MHGQEAQPITAAEFRGSFGSFCGDAQLKLLMIGHNVQHGKVGGVSTTGPTPTHPTSSGISVANRYGAPKQHLSRGAKRGIVIAALAVAVVLAGYFAFVQAKPSVSGTDVGFNVSDPHHATVDFQVTKDPEATAQCAIQALNETYAIVGWKVATIGPAAEGKGNDGGRTTVHRIQLRTESPSVTGGVNACWIVK